MNFVYARWKIWGKHWKITAFAGVGVVHVLKVGVWIQWNRKMGSEKRYVSVRNTSMIFTRERFHGVELIEIERNASTFVTGVTSSKWRMYRDRNNFKWIEIKACR